MSTNPNLGFDMKYDRDGFPIRPKNSPLMIEQEPQQATTALIDEQPQTQAVVSDVPAVVEQVTVQEQEEAPEIAAPIAVKEPTETPQQLRFRNLREEKSRAERERDELLRRVQEYEASSAKSTNINKDEDVEPRPDDLVEWRHVEKKIKKLEAQLQNVHQQSATSNTEARLKAQYPDFDKVVSRENIEILRDAYPEIAETLNASSDLYKKAVSAYTLIKKLGIQPEDTHQDDRARMQKNLAKPKSMASVSPQQSDSPLTRANAFSNGLTDELKAQLLREMVEARKNR